MALGDPQSIATALVWREVVIGNRGKFAVYGGLGIFPEDLLSYPSIFSPHVSLGRGRTRALVQVPKFIVNYIAMPRSEGLVSHLAIADTRTGKGHRARMVQQR